MGANRKSIFILDNDQRHVVSLALVDYVRSLVRGRACDEFFWQQLSITVRALEQFCPGLLEVLEPELFGGKR